MILIDAANVSGGGAVLLQYLVSQLLRRQVPFHVLKKASVRLDAPARNYTDTRINFLNRRATLRAFIQQINPTTLLCFGNFPPPFPQKIRTVTYFHNLHYLNGHDSQSFSLRDKLKRTLRRLYLRANLHHSDAFVVQTPYVQRLFRQTFGVAQDKVYLFPFYDQERLLNTAAQIRGADPRPAGSFLYVSGSEPHKNHVNLLRAWQLLHQQGISPTLYLTIAPQSPYTTRALLAKIETLKQAGVAIENLGYLSYDELLRITATCAACVFPSVNETIGLGLVEAYWMGHHILASRRPYVADVVKPSADFDPYSPVDIADTVKQYLAGGLPRPELILKNQIDPFIQWLYQATISPASKPVAKIGAIDFHDGIAAQFAGKYESSAAFGERFRVWTSLFDRYVDPADYVMDLGCGSGIFSNYLADKGCLVTGIDGSAAMIQLCNQQKTSGRARYVMQSLPLPHLNDYPMQDVVIASSLLEYVDDMALVLQQVVTLLKPGGLLIVSIPNRISLYRRLERVLFALSGWPRYFAHIRNVSTETLFNEQLAGLGFDVLETVYFSSYDPLSRCLKWLLPRPYVNNLFVGVYRKR